MGSIWNSSSPTVVVTVTSQGLVGTDDGLPVGTPVEPPSVGKPVVSTSLGEPVANGLVGVELALVGDLGGKRLMPSSSPVGDPVETGSEVGR
jgi:hypothetical protein